MAQENSRKLFPDIGKKFPEKPLSHDSFSGNYFQVNFMTHDPFLGKNLFSWVSTHKIYLEIVSGISPESLPVFWK